MYIYISVLVLFYAIASSVPADCSTMDYYYVDGGKEKNSSSNLSLSIPQLIQWRWADSKTKIYNYTITRNKTTLECVLHDPTQHDVTMYKLSFYLDETQLRGSKVNISDSRCGSIKQTIKLNKNSKNIICKADLLTINATKEILRNEIALNHVPSISPPTLSITGPPKLQVAEYIEHNFTQMYIYNFTDGEHLTLDCALTYPEGSEVYDLTYYIGDDKQEVKVEGTKTPRNIQTFVLKKESTVIKCLAENKGTNFPKNLTNTVYLQYSPWLTGSSSGQLYASHSRGWMTWSLGAFLVLVCSAVILAAVLISRQKESDMEPNYANLAKDHNYLTMPTPEPKVLPSSNTSYTPEMEVKYLYCEIQDTKVDPKRFISELPYAVPYDQSNYSEPYVPRFDGPYAVPYVS